MERLGLVWMVNCASVALSLISIMEISNLDKLHIGPVLARHPQNIAYAQWNNHQQTDHPSIVSKVH